MSERARRPTEKGQEYAAERSAQAQRAAKRKRTSADDDPPQPSPTPDDSQSTPSTSQSAGLTTYQSTIGNLSGAALKKSKFEERYKVASRTPEQVLAAQMKSWTSAVYEHFTSPPKLVVGRDEVTYIFVCKRNPSVEIQRRRYDDSTSNLVKHVKLCDPKNSAESAAITAFAHGSSYHPAKHRVKIAVWVARRNRPFAIVEDPELREIFQDLNSAVQHVSRYTVPRDVVEIHNHTKDHIIKFFEKNVEGSIHVGVDGWTSPNVFAFLGVTVHYVSEGLLKMLTLDFVKVVKAHTGVYLARRLAECLREFGLDTRLLGLACDNGSNNDTMVEELSRLIPTFGGSSYRVRCFAHVVNLVAKAVLSAFAGRMTKSQLSEHSTPDLDAQLAALEDVDGDGMVGDEDMESEEEDDEEEDGDELAPDVEASDAAVVDEVADEADLEHRLPSLGLRDAKVGQLALTKLRKLAQKIHWSPTIREALVDDCKASNLRPRRIVRDVSTRWNSSAELIHSALLIEKALNLLVIRKEFNRGRGVQLERFRLSQAEWAILKGIKPLLDAILYATKEVSKSSVPMVHQIIPLIDSITGVFDKFIDNQDAHPAVRHAAFRGLLMLNKYYEKTDDAVVYRIAMLLHPCIKTSYFIRAGWSAEWIEAAKNLARNEWHARYKVALTAAPASSSLMAASPGDEDSDEERFAMIRGEFNKHQEAPLATALDPLEEWLASPPIPTKDDPLKYWHANKVAKHPLAQMALDFLSIPATSTDVERAFSKGGLTVSKLRHSLNAKTTRASVVLGSWASQTALIPVSDIIEKFKSKHRRPKKKVNHVEVTSESEPEIVEVA